MSDQIQAGTDLHAFGDRPYRRGRVCPPPHEQEVTKSLPAFAIEHPPARNLVVSKDAWLGGVAQTGARKPAIPRSLARLRRHNLVQLELIGGCRERKIVPQALLFSY
jgi:hypothetical protein